MRRWTLTIVTIVVACASGASLLTCGGKSSPTAPTPPVTRIIGLDGNLAFGDVQVGSTSIATLTITNTGTGTLTVSGITCPSGFSASWTSGTIAAGASQAVTITFAPTAAQRYSGTLTVNVDHTGGTNAISASGTGTIAGKLRWPIDCVRDVTCGSLGYPDIDNDSKAYNCGRPGYAGHEGTDINISASQMAAGMDVFAAADGVVLWVFDGKYDNCPNASEPDCVTLPGTPSPGSTTGTTVCTHLGNYCGTGSCCCYWCFAGGNVIVLRHTGIPGVFATRYDHLRRSSIIVAAGQSVQKGQKIAQAASAGRSTGAHLHFEVWGSGFYMPVDPWAGSCGPNTDNSLWEFDYR